MPDVGTQLRPDILETLRRLTDDDLVLRVEALAKREHVDTALLVAHLAEARHARRLPEGRLLLSLRLLPRRARPLRARGPTTGSRSPARPAASVVLQAPGLAVNLTTVRLLAHTHARQPRGRPRVGPREDEVRSRDRGAARPVPGGPPSIRKLPPRGRRPAAAAARPDGQSVPLASGAWPSAPEARPSQGPRRAAPEGPPAGSWPVPAVPGCAAWELPGRHSP
jgi:hypothetical protein